MEPKVGMEFVERALQKNHDIVGVNFIMTIDQSKISTSNTPFAMIDEHSAIPSEQEILFTMHTVFRVVEIKQTPKNNRLWEVHLTITDDNDPQLSTLTNRIKQGINGEVWDRMGKLMLKNASIDSNRAHIYHQLGWLKDDQGKYPEVAKFYEKCLEIYRKTLPENDVSSAFTYGNIGLVDKNMGEYSKALGLYEKANKIFEISLPPNHPDLATSYNNIGEVYRNMGEYSKALSYLEKTLSIKQKSLPSTHPSIKNVMNSIAAVKKKL
ncbi:unnamed protein product [Rotaria socialis]|uniref:Tetratricopeptide repeat protein n=1 Tax=Rotaria socialis TaxID=392032 RepID=A0A818MYV7_9BILA|nr:unnamed protein product [Rotaria socialis]